MAVVVQQMVFPQAAGILFTADPVTFNRKVASVEASFGLGEALVSGQVNADVYKVRDGEVVAKALATKQLAIHASPASGTQEQAIELERQEQPALTDGQVVRIVQLRRRIEAQLGRPQDIEWCPVDDGFRIVQSRPITTLFPIPAAGDREDHVYVSVGHQQMMTDPMKPPGALPIPADGLAADVRGRREAVRRRHPAAGFASEPRRPPEGPGEIRSADRDALQTILERGDFIPTLPDGDPGGAPAGGAPAPIGTDPIIVAELIGRSEASIATLKRDIRTESGSALLDFILADVQELKRMLFDPQSLQVIMGDGGHPVAERAAAGVAGRAGEARGRAGSPGRCPDLPRQVRLALRRRDRRHEATLERTLHHARAHDPRQHQELRAGRRKEAPRARAARGLEEGTGAAGALAGLARRGAEGRRDQADDRRVRTFSGYREYPNYGMASRYFVYKQALLEEAERLVQAHVLREKEDIFYLTFQELHDVVRTHQVDEQLIRQRKDAFRSYQALTAPRVLTSDGEVIAGAYRRDDLPAGVLVGLPVSAETIEGRARIILDIAQADLEAGDILVTAYTDPSWTPRARQIAPIRGRSRVPAGIRSQLHRVGQQAGVRRRESRRVGSRRARQVPHVRGSPPWRPPGGRQRPPRGRSPPRPPGP